MGKRGTKIYHVQVQVLYDNYHHYEHLNCANKLNYYKKEPESDTEGLRTDVKLYEL